MFNTLSDLAAIGGVKDISRYWNKVSTEQEQVMAQQEAAQAQQAQAEAQGQVAAQTQALQSLEAIKSQGMTDREVLKLQQRDAEGLRKLRLELIKLLNSDDLSRDKLEVDALIKGTELLGKLGVTVTQDQVNQTVDRPRNNPYLP